MLSVGPTTDGRALMNHSSRRRNPILWLGVALAALTGLSFALKLTAVPVVMDAPLATLVIATFATAALFLAVLRERRGATGDGRARFGLGGTALVFVLIIAGLSVQERFTS